LFRTTPKVNLSKIDPFGTIAKSKKKGGTKKKSKSNTREASKKRRKINLNFYH